MGWQTAVKNWLKATTIQFGVWLKGSSINVKKAVVWTWNHTKDARNSIRKTVAALTALALGVVVTYWVTKKTEDVSGDSQAYSIDVQTNPDLVPTPNGAVGGTYLLPGGIRKVGRPPTATDTCAGRYEWAHRLGAIDAGSSTIALTVTGHTTDVTRILAVEPLIVGTRGTAPTTGAVVTWAGRGSEPNVRYVNADLDADPPSVVTSDGKGFPVRPELQVTQGQAETFNLTASALQCDCKWEVVVHLMVKGKAIDETFPRTGFFHTIGTLKSYRWLNDSWTTDTGQSPPSPLIALIPDACTLFNSRDLSAAVGTPLFQQAQPVTVAAVSPGTGASGQALLNSVCQYSPAGAPASGKASALLDFDGLKTSDAARGEFEALTAGHESGGERTKAVTVAGTDAANLFGDILFVRKGRLIIHMQIDPTLSQATFIALMQKAVAKAGK